MKNSFIKLLSVLLFLICLTIALNAQNTISAKADLFSVVEPDSTVSLQGISVVWGDYDNDGDLDILYKGTKLTDFLDTIFYVSIYENNGSDFTAENKIVLNGKEGEYADWADFDNDGDLDIIITGLESMGRPFTKVFLNKNNYYGEVNNNPEGLYVGSKDIGDFDNDGYKDLLVTGYNESFTLVSKLLKNNGLGEFSEIYNGSLIPVSEGATAFGDYDNDGNLDIVLTGLSSSGNISKIYRNTGSGFIEVYVNSLTDATFSSVNWFDYDNDGDLDLFLTGNSNSGHISKLYQNTGAGFTEVFPGTFTGVSYGYADCGDYDNDGDMDIILSGYNESSNPFTQIYRNDGTGFTTLNLAYLENLTGSVSWGDYDNDGDLDILQTGRDDLGDNKIKLYSNNLDTPNQPAAAPDNLSFSVTETDVTLTWDKATDTETPQDGLSYNLFLYKEDPVKSKSKTLVRKIENIQYNYSGITLSNLSDGNYSWSIQAFDTGLKEGEISIEQNFSIGGPEINIQGNSLDIPDNQSTTSSNDFTDFGNVKYDEDLVRSFTINNTGISDLTLGTATLTGTGFSITQPEVSVLMPDQSTSFTVTFAPENVSIINGEVSIPNDDNNENPYNFAVSGSGLKGDPTITWSNPDDITYGSQLDEIQLNATANIEGAFEYNPANGTMLEIGADQALEVEFTPTDETNYNKASKTVYITVTEATGIEEETMEILKIYPNPNNGEFYIHFETKGNELVNIQLIDLSGKIILNEQLTASDLSNYQIQIPGAVKGTFILRIIIPGKEVNQRIVIQ